MLGVVAVDLCQDRTLIGPCSRPRRRLQMRCKELGKSGQQEFWALPNCSQTQTG